MPWKYRIALVCLLCVWMPLRSYSFPLNHLRVPCLKIRTARVNQSPYWIWIWIFALDFRCLASSWILATRRDEKSLKIPIQRTERIDGPTELRTTFPDTVRWFEIVLSPSLVDSSNFHPHRHPASRFLHMRFHSSQMQTCATQPLDQIHDNHRIEWILDS